MDRLSLIRQIQFKLNSGLDQAKLQKIYRQWFRHICNYDKIALILYDSEKKYHDLIDAFPESFCYDINCQIEEGIADWAGHQKSLFDSGKTIFLPLVSHSVYLGLIELEFVKAGELTDNSLELLEITSGLIANYFYDRQFAGLQTGNLSRINDELFDLAIVGAISYSVVHKISNPLTTIIGRSGLLLTSENRLKPNLEIIEKEAARVSSIIHEFLALSKKHVKHETDQPVEIDKLIKKSVALLDNYARVKRVRLVTHFQEEHLQVSANYFRLLIFFSKVIFNVLLRVKGPQQIKVSASAKQGFVIVKIDSGITGIKLFNEAISGVAIAESHGTLTVKLAACPELSESLN